MKILSLIFCIVLLFPSIVLAEENTQVNYDELIKQAEVIQFEAQSLSDKLKEINPNVIRTSSLTSSLTSSFTDLITGIDTTIKKLGELIDSAKNLTDKTSEQVTQTGNIVQTSISGLTNKMQEELSKLNTQLTELIKSVNSTVQSTDATIQTINTTIKHVDTTTTNTINYINSLGGRITTSYYIGTGDLDSSADLMLWRNNKSPQYSYLKFTVDGIDNAESRNFSFILGTVHNIFSFGAGYIQDGLGVDLGLNQYGTHGFDSRVSLYRMNDLGINTELGFRPSILKGSRLFIFGEDLLNNTRTGGGGISYERSF